MDTDWLSYVPQHVAADLLAHPGVSPVGREQRLTVVSLFADISGFTAIAEALGKTGTEELTAILNATFQPMIETITGYGGSVGKFGGDAMTVIFPYDQASHADTVSRAVRCALDLQAIMRSVGSVQTSAGVYEMAVKIGLAQGRLLLTSVGVPEIRLEYIMAGSAIDRCADAEHHAERGETVVSDDLLPFLVDPVMVAQREGHSVLSALGGEIPAAAPGAPVTLTAAAISQLAAYLHPAVAERIRRDLSGFINEHRKVTILFVSFSGFDYDDDPQVRARLQAYFDPVVRTVARYDGYLNKIDMGDKGSKYIVLFGAPVAHEEDEQRALRCALDLLALPIPLRIGVNTDFVYSGRVGSDARQEYTVMGDGVNLAARLMQAAAPGQILVSGFTRRAVPDSFVWQTLAPIRVKGKSEPISVYGLEGVRMQPAGDARLLAYSLPMVGRAAQRAVLRERLNLVLAGQGQVVAISAEAGMGKSRLAAEFLAGAYVPRFSGECESFATAVPYLVWRSLWRGVFGLREGDGAQQLAQRLDSPEFIRLMPLLAPILNLDIPDNDFTRTLDGQMRVDLAHALLLDLLRRRETPVLFLLEDLHWIDPLSLDLLRYLARNIADLPVMLLLLYRPPFEPDIPRMTAVTLDEFTPQESAALLRLKLAQQFDLEADEEFAPPLLDQIMERAQGNPFYIEEIVNFLHDQGIDPRDPAALQRVVLPDSLYSLIMSRLDQLLENQKITAKVASVVGRLFRARWLWGAYPQLGSPDFVHQTLGVLESMDIALLDRLEPETEYLFKHITTREIVYESISHDLRGRLHELVARYIEAAYTASLPSFYDMLAHHYGSTANSEKQRFYFRLAGGAAQKAYANAAAISYFERLLPLLPEADQVEILLRLGTIRQLLGEWDQAEAHFRQALEISTRQGDQAALARSQSALGYLLVFSSSDSAAALRLLETARSTFERLADRVGLGETLERLAYLHQQASDLPAAQAAAQALLTSATAAGDQLGICAAQRILGVVYLDQGDLEQALVHLEQQLAVASAIDNRQDVIYATSNLGGVYLFQGDYPRALDYLRRALDTAAEIGYRRAFGAVVGNLGEVYRERGEVENARLCYQRALYAAFELGDRTDSLIAAVGNLAVLERGALADLLFPRVVALARQLENPYGVCEFLYQQAVYFADQQRLSEALPLALEAAQIAGEIGRADLAFSAQVLALRSQNAIPDLIALLDQTEQPAEQAAIHDALWLLNRDPDRARTAAALYADLYRQTFRAEYRQRVAALIGELPPAPPPLPPLPASVTPIPITIDELIARLEL